MQPLTTKRVKNISNPNSIMSEVTLSKNQQKRLLRAQRRKETKAEWRMKVALKRKQRKALKDLVEKNCAENETDELKEKTEIADQTVKLPEGESELRRETNEIVKESTDASAQLVDKKSKRSKPIKEQLPPKHHVIFDSSFDSLMNEREIASLASQITRCYASNRRVQQPFHLTVTSFSDALQAAFKESHPDFEKFQITFTKESYDLLYPKENLIYLTADADEVVDELEDGKCYIIGGLVDRNRHKVTISLVSL